MAGAWKELLEMPASKRQALGKEARQRIEDLFSIQSIARRYEHLYWGIGKDRESS
jgi:glycosyltransferase involved in cell wall biosynthesis